MSHRFDLVGAEVVRQRLGRAGAVTAAGPGGASSGGRSGVIGGEEKTQCRRNRVTQVKQSTGTRLVTILKNHLYHGRMQVVLLLHLAILP